MGNDQEDTATTVQQTDAESQGQSSEQPPDQTATENENFVPQQRFDQQTKARREAERRAEMLEQQNRELIALMAQQSQGQQSRQQNQEPEPEDDTARAVKKYLAPFQQQFQQLQGQLAAQSAGDEVRRVARSDTPPEVLERATRIVADWRRTGTPGDANHALRFAYGDYMLMQADEASGVQQQRRQFNGAAGAVQTGNSAPKGTKGPKQLSDAEIERLPPEQQAEYFSARLGDQEF